MPASGPSTAINGRKVSCSISALSHALLQRWENDKILRGDPAKVAAEKVRALEYVRRHKGDGVRAGSLLSLMQERADQELDARRWSQRQDDRRRPQT